MIVAALLLVAWGVAVTGAQSGPDLKSALLAADDGRVQSLEHRQVVASALTQDDPAIRALALRAIGRTRRAEFLPQAMAGLRHASLDVRREAAFAVAHIGSGAPDAHAAAERALRDAIGSERDALVFSALAEEYGRLLFPAIADVDAAAGVLRANVTRLAAAGVLPPLAELGVARGVEALARRAAQLKSGSDGVHALLASLVEASRVARDAPNDVLRARVRRLAVSGLLSLDSIAPAIGHARRAGPTETLVGPAVPAGPSASASRGPAGPAGPSASPTPRPSASPDPFERAVRDPDAQVRRLGVIGLARGDVSLETARSLLADETMIVRHAVASRIGPKMPEVAEAATRDAHLNVRLAGIDALGTAGACREACTSRLARPDVFGPAWHEGAHAIVALARTDAEAARPHISRAAKATIWQVRMYAARAAEHTRQADVLSALADDAHVNVRHAALASWRAAKLPGLEAAAVAALSSDDGQLLLEAVTALRSDTAPDDGAAIAPHDGKARNGRARSPSAPSADSRVPGTEVVAALRAALARATAQNRETSRDWRIALLERIDELDPDRMDTLRPYLADFDPAIAARAAALINARLPLGAARVAPMAGQARRAGPTGDLQVPTWSEVAALEGATVTMRLRGNRQLTIRLYPQVAPTAVARLVAQVRAGEWNGRTFHRVEPGFVVQGGSPSSNEYAGADAFTRDEFSALAHVRGTVGISTRGPDTGDGQIFVNLVDNPRLDFAFTLIGSVTSAPSLLDDVVEGEVIESASVAVPGR